MRKTKYLKNVATLALDTSLCTGCGMCEVVCPHAVLEVIEGLARIVDRDSCMECGACARNCPEGALAVKTGVGCAHAVLNSTLGIKGACCALPGDESSCIPDKPTCVPSPPRDSPSKRMTAESASEPEPD